MLALKITSILYNYNINNKNNKPCVNNFIDPKIQIGGGSNITGTICK